ncbi:hypothetical protein ACLFMI_11245 [Pseudonocardia nantongensis]|uniref:hypothetical protein n=1 Tax=Pseudonocardia nantongensis TaxID=1181885 RepID=UPI00397D82AE
MAWLQRALAEPPALDERGEVLLELGVAEPRLGSRAAIDHLRAATEMTTEPKLRVRAVRQLASALTRSARADAAVTAIESAIPAIEEVDRELALLLEADLARHVRQAGTEARAGASRRLSRLSDLERGTPGARQVYISRGFEKARGSRRCSTRSTHIRPRPTPRVLRHRGPRPRLISGRCHGQRSRMGGS